MITEYDSEPTPGLPGELPAGERILWQGSPDMRQMAFHAFHIRAVGAYFVALTGWGAIQAARGYATWLGTGVTLGIGIVGVGLIAALAWASARSTIYTLTNRRIVMRFGIALPKCVNLPLGAISAADLAGQGDGKGDIALRLGAQQRLGWMQLWPHARPWAINNVQPMLRSIPDAERVAGLLARTVGAAQGKPVPSSAPVLAVAA